MDISEALPIMLAAMQTEFPDSRSECRWFIRDTTMEHLTHGSFFYVNEFKDNQEFTLLGCPFQIVSLGDMSPDFLPIVLVHNNGWVANIRSGKVVLEYVGKEPPKDGFGPIG